MKKANERKETLKKEFVPPGFPNFVQLNKWDQKDEHAVQGREKEFQTP